MSRTESVQKPVGAGARDDFAERVDRCLAMVLHHAEVQEIAALVKRVHTERGQEKTKCSSNQPK
jgi:hypothetical protein